MRQHHPPETRIVIARADPIHGCVLLRADEIVLLQIGRNGKGIHWQPLDRVTIANVLNYRFNGLSQWTVSPILLKSEYPRKDNKINRLWEVIPCRLPGVRLFG